MSPPRYLLLIRSAAAELPAVQLDNALRICLLTRDQVPDRFERAAVRWIGRFVVECPRAPLEDIERVAFEFGRLPDPSAVRELTAVCQRHGLRIRL